MCVTSTKQRAALRNAARAISSFAAAVRVSP